MNNNIEIFCVTDKHFNFFSDIQTYSKNAISKKPFVYLLRNFSLLWFRFFGCLYDELFSERNF